MQIDVSPPVQVEQGFQKDVLVLEYFNLPGVRLFIKTRACFGYPSLVMYNAVLRGSKAVHRHCAFLPC